MDQVGGTQLIVSVVKSALSDRRSGTGIILTQLEVSFAKGWKRLE